MRLYLWTMGTRYDVHVFELFQKNTYMSNTFLYGSFNGKTYSNISHLSINTLLSILNKSPSTNGLYSVSGFIDTKNTGNYDVSDGNYKNIKKTMFLISTKSFLELYLNDIHISTTSADKKYFYQSKRVHPKLFVRKHLLKMKVPSKNNHSNPSHETIKDSMYADFEAMSVKEIKNILKSYGPVGSGNKGALINKLIKIIQYGL